ncbi:MAG: hypothetical protein MZV49_03570 [Rhodopseudomonas palustris]|nr:hypothetical protein [Rhodopseudomonas palustris]
MLCSGKVYFDLYEEREKRGIDDVLSAAHRAALSVPGQGAGAASSAASSSAEVVWCQEEPQATWAPGTSSSPISNGC